MFTLYIYIIIMLALTFMRYFKFISYISKKVSGEDVAWKYKYPLEKIQHLCYKSRYLLF